MNVLKALMMVYFFGLVTACDKHEPHGADGKHAQQGGHGHEH